MDGRNLTPKTTFYRWESFMAGFPASNPDESRRSCYESRTRGGGGNRESSLWLFQAAVGSRVIVFCHSNLMTMMILPRYI